MENWGEENPFWKENFSYALDYELLVKGPSSVYNAAVVGIFSFWTIKKWLIKGQTMKSSHNKSSSFAA